MFISKLKKNLGLVALTKMAFLLLGFSLSGCGENSAPKNTPPNVQIVDVNSFNFVTDTVNPSNRIFVVEADTSDVDGTISNINWSILSGQDFELIDFSTEIVQFTAPLIDSDEIDLLVLEVEATDNQGSKTTDTVEIDLNDDLIIFIPLTSAEKGEEVVINALIFGRKSKISGFNWAVSSNVDVTLFDASTDTVSFLAPNISSVSDVSLTLEVSFMDGSENQIFNAFVNLFD
jgi:hypothetical protein